MSTSYERLIEESGKYTDICMDAQVKAFFAFQMKKRGVMANKVDVARNMDFCRELETVEMQYMHVTMALRTALDRVASLLEMEEQNSVYAQRAIQIIKEVTQ